MTINKIAEDAIGLFLESLDHMNVQHDLFDKEIEQATAKALVEIGEGTRDEQAKLDAFDDLLAAAQNLFAYFHDDNSLTSAANELVGDLNAAIAKATGTKPEGA